MNELNSGNLTLFIFSENKRCVQEKGGVEQTLPLTLCLSPETEQNINVSNGTALLVRVGDSTKV